MKLPTEFTEAKKSDEMTNLDMIIFGPPKVGKTTFSADWPDSLLIECEPGAADFVKARRVDVKSMEEMREVFKALYSETNTYKTIIIDTLDQVATWIEAEVCKEVGIPNIMDAKKGERHGAQWGLYKDKVLAFVLASLKLGKNVIFLAHSKKLETDGNGSVLNPRTINLYGSTTIQVLSLVNNIGFMFAKEVEGGKVKRILSFKAGPQVEAGSRHPALRDKEIELPLVGGYKAFEQQFKLAEAPKPPAVKLPATKEIKK